jgi:hypothetical protein
MDRVRGSVSLRALAVFGFVVASVWPLRGAAADHCEPNAPPARRGRRAAPTFGLRLGIERANYESERYAGNFAGLGLGAVLGDDAWDMSLDATLYHLVKNGLDIVGPGDPFLRGRVRVWQAEASTFAFGVALGLSAPLGDAEAGLGMGHFMIHPGLWAGSRGEKVRTEWSLGYGRMLGDGEHGEPTGPLVSPMNSSELSAGGALSWDLHPRFALRALGVGAVPVAAPAGEARLMAGFGARLGLGALTLSVTASFPVVGDPFTDKLEVGIGYSF